MNPGYLGRSELPEGLKALFRPITAAWPGRSRDSHLSTATVGFLRHLTSVEVELEPRPALVSKRTVFCQGDGARFQAHHGEHVHGRLTCGRRTQFRCGEEGGFLIKWNGMLSGSSCSYIDTCDL